MNVAFSGEEIAAFLTLLVAGVGGFASLRVRVHNQGTVIKRLEEEVAELQEGQVAVALLQQTVQEFRRTVESFNTQAASTRQEMADMGKSIVRLETKLERRSFRPPQD